MSGPPEPPDCPTYAVDEARIAADLAQIVYRDEGSTVTAGDVIAALRDAGIGVWAGGGTPRDWLMGSAPRDLDLFLDRELEEVHAVLRRAFPGIDPAHWPRPEGFVMIWGDRRHLQVDLMILRSWRDIRNQDAFTTRFPVRRDLAENAQLLDFSVNAFYYDFGRRLALDPLGCGLDDLDHRILRLVRHPRALAGIFSTTLRIIEYLGRGYSPTADTLAYLERSADRDILHMGRRLWRWIPKNVLAKGRDLDDFEGRLRPWLRQPEARHLLDEVLADLRRAAG